MQRVAAYTRVSTDEQAEVGHSLEAQLDAIRRHCSAKGLVIEEVYEERGKSAKTDNRPEFQRLLTDIRAGRIDIVVVHKLDRFSRSLVDVMTYLNEFHRLGVGFVSVSEDFDFSSPWGKVILAMLAAFAQWYLDNLSQETKKGKKQRVAKGLHNGTLAFGYMTPRRLRKQLDSARAEAQPNPETLTILEKAIAAAQNKAETEAIPCPFNADGVRLAYSLYATGQYSDHDIAVALNKAGYRTTGSHGSREFVRDSVISLLKNRFYLGEVSYGFTKRDKSRLWNKGNHITH